MSPQLRDVIENSLLFRAVAQLLSWAEHSLIVRLLNDERVLVGGLVAFLLVSLARVLSSGVHVTVQFLSFALLFVVLTAVTWNYTKPLSNT